MDYINPIEILKLNFKSLDEINNTVIKKAKRLLYADIELSDDGHIDYHGRIYSKNDCEKVILELDNKAKVQFYQYLNENQALNSFLANGDYENFKAIEFDPILKNPELVDFISPYLSENFGEIILNTFIKRDLELFTFAMESMPPFKQVYLSKAFRGLSNEIEGRISDLKTITEDIKDETSEYNVDNIDKIIKDVKLLFPVKYLAKTPKYFQSQINKIAESINFLQLAVFYEFNSTYVSYKLLEYLFKFNIDSAAKPTFEKNYRLIKKQHEVRSEQEKNAPTLNIWADKLSFLLTKLNELKLEEKNEFIVENTFTSVNNNINIDELNKLPSYADEIRNQTGIILRNLSLESWNKHSDIKSAISFIRLALEIKLPEDTKTKLLQDKKKLTNLQKKYQYYFVCYFCGKNNVDDASYIPSKMYMITKYASLFNRRVEYLQRDLKIPRCRSCKSIHSEKSKLNLPVFWGIVIVGLASLFFIEFLNIFSLGIVFFLAWTLGKYTGSEPTEEAGIKRMQEYSSHPIVKESKKDGWSFKDPRDR